MKNNKFYFALLICLTTFLLNAAPQRENTLREIYSAGTVRFVPELTLDESTMPEGTFFEGIVSIECDEEGFVYNEEQVKGFLTDLDNLLTSAIGEYLQEELNNSDVGSLEYKIIEKMLEDR